MGQKVPVGVIGTAYLQKLRLLGRDVRLYLVTSALVGLTVYGGIQTVLLNLYLLRLGYGPAFIGSANAATWLSFALFSLPAGMLGRRWDTRRMMIAGMIGMIGGAGLVPMAELLSHPWQQVWLLAARVLQGLGMALYVVNGSPFLMAATGPQERNHAFSAQGALWPLAGFAGSLVGGILPSAFAAAFHSSLTQPAPYRCALLVAALLLIPGVPVLWTTHAVRIEQPRAQAAPRTSAPYGLIALVMLCGVLRTAGEGGVQSFLNVYLDAELRTSPAQIGTLMAVAQLLSVPAAMAMPLLAARWGKPRTIGLGTLGAALALLPLVLIPHMAAASLGFVAMTAILVMVRAAFTVYSQELAAPVWRSVMSGATSLAAALGAGITMLAGGYLARALGYRGFFGIAAGLILAGALLFGAYFRVPRGELASSPEE
jgi:MFS family permease